jgi:N-acetylglucosaminyldiphosphoundecaprenol N-acetyl-beta-D-mannosaminyltransferase
MVGQEQGARQPEPSAIVLGVPVWGLGLEQFVDLAVERIRGGGKTLFTTANAHSIVLAGRLPVFARHFHEADAVLPDGTLAVWGARAVGGEVRGRVAGPDFFEAFLERAARERLSVFFLGTTEATLGKMVARCRDRFPGLDIRGTFAPPFGPIDAPASRRMVEAVNAVRPDALFVAMTAPKQEIWLADHLDRLDVSFAMGVGAAFDFLAGTKPRAPRALASAGWEWLYRLANEPRRMARRQLSSVVFLWLLAGQVLRMIFVRRRPPPGRGRPGESHSTRRPGSR